MKIVIDSVGKVLMWSESGSPTPPEGCQSIELCQYFEAAFRATPNQHGLIMDEEGFSAIPAPPAPPTPTTAAKLSTIGLTVNELRQALELS